MFWKNKITDVLQNMLSTSVPSSCEGMAKLGLDGALEYAFVGFVFVLVECESAKELSQMSAYAIQAAVDGQAIVVANAGGLIQIALSPDHAGICNSDPPSLLAHDINSRLRQSARIVYGYTQAHVGIVGIPQRKNWGVYPIQICSILRSLIAATPGEPLDVGMSE